MPAVGWDMFHAANTIRKYFYSYWRSSPLLKESKKLVYFIAKEHTLFLLYLPFVGLQSDPNITEYFIVYRYLLNYIIRLLKIGFYPKLRCFNSDIHMEVATCKLRSHVWRDWAWFMSSKMMSPAF